MADAPPVLTRSGRLMLAALGERTTLADFMLALEMRPEVAFSEADAKVGLEALTETALVKRHDGDEPEWAITKLGHAALMAPVDVPGDPAAVAFAPHPGAAMTTTEMSA